MTPGDPLPVLENCDDCGACCQQTFVPPFVVKNGVHEAESRQIPQKLLADVLSYWEFRLKIPEQPCLWYDKESRQCRHYEHRPSACRNFEINSSSCHAIRDKEGISS